MTSAHSHTCPDCGESFDCNAPIVRAEDEQNVCILVHDEGEQVCDDCWGRESEGAEQPGAIARIH